ncbi:MAG: DUF2236 domain-containing protein [Solirubrobacteraceae bacterium]|nr:DUF2236 domain-containing protein [Solirubrobacteraceae bacterium]
MPAIDSSAAAVRELTAWNPAARERPLAAPLGPDSVTWKVFGDLTYVMGAARRLLMDVAHPTIADGVREFSVFQTDPYGRGERTLAMILGVIYGQEHALATAQRLREGHQPFRGERADGSRWSALEPEAYHWVHASIIDGVWTQQQALGRGWRAGEVEQFYDEMHEVGRMYGVRDRDMPPTWAKFRVWFDEFVADRLERSDMTDAVLQITARPTPPPVPVLGWKPVWAVPGRTAGRLNMLLTGGLLPPLLRERLGVHWTPWHQRAFDANAVVSRAMVPRLPDRIRLLPDTYTAMKEATR